ncbi:MAG: extracellular solute-binding protein [Lachnospiraceae bacterium]|nr:extracellular solute-binding protein [Lachnospiraceae bacterium]
MKKKVISGLLTICLAATTLAGCGSNGDSNGTSADEAAADTAVSAGEDGLTTDDITLKVWESSGVAQQFIEQAGEAFTKQHPNIKIEYENVELADSNGRIAMDGPAGVGADAFACPNNTIGNLVAGGHILPVTNEADVKDNVSASGVKAVTYDGKLYGYPFSSDTFALFYNKDLVADPPKTWEDVEKFCETFNQPGKYGLIFNPGSAYYSVMFNGKNGNQLFGPDGTDASDTYMETQDAIDGMTYFQSFRKYLDVPAADISDDSICLAAFTEGKAAMYVTGAWNIQSCLDAGINLGVTTLPSLPGEDHPCMAFSNARTMVVSAYSEHPAEAEAFAKFLVTPEMQKLRVDITGEVPSAEIDVDSEYVKGLSAQLDYAYPAPSIPEANDWWTVMDSACANIWDGADVTTELNAVNDRIASK